MVRIFVILVAAILSLLTTLSLTINVVWLSILVYIGFFVAYIIAQGLIYFLLAFLLGLFINKKKDTIHYNKFYHLCYYLYVKYTLSLFGVKVKRTGLEKIPNDTNFVIVSNHLSNFDPMIMDQCLYKYNLTFVAKKSLFKIPCFGKFIHKIGYLCLDCSNLRSEAKTIMKVTKMLEDNECSVAVYPEGTRNFTNETLLPFKYGCFHLAIKSKRPIVVTTIKGTENIKNHLLTKIHKVDFDVLGVITYEQYKDLNTHEIGDIISKMMEDNLLSK